MFNKESAFRGPEFEVRPRQFDIAGADQQDQVFGTGRTLEINMGTSVGLDAGCAFRASSIAEHGDPQTAQRVFDILK